VGLLLLLGRFSVPGTFFIMHANANGDYPKYVAFARTRYFQNWDCTKIAAANTISEPSHNMGLTLQVFMDGYHHDPDGDDFTKFRVLAMGIDRDENPRSYLSDYIIKEMKITIKKMSLENNPYNYYDVYSYVGNYWINDHNAKVSTAFWRAQNVSYQVVNDAEWVEELLLAGSKAYIGYLIGSLGLGIVGTATSYLAGKALEALVDKEPVCPEYDPECWPYEYEPVFYKAVNSNPWNFWFSNSSASLGGEAMWYLLDDCEKNHRLEISASMTYAQYHYYYGWCDEHTMETSVTLSSVLGDGYLSRYDYEVKWGDVSYQENPGGPIVEGYDAPDTEWQTLKRLYTGKLYYDFEYYGEVDPSFGQRQYLYSGYLNETNDNDLHDWYVADVPYKSYYQDNSAFIRLDVPGGVDFDLEIYDTSTGQTYYSNDRTDETEEIIIQISSSKTYKIGVHIYQGSGEYILAAYAVYQHYLGGGTPPGGECPYIYVWNSSDYTLDNNVLDMSEISNGSDVKDLYRLEQRLAPLYTGNYLSAYSLMLGEFENEHSYVDKVKLYAVDHDPNVNVALTPDGQILTYSDPSPPVFVRDNYGIEWLPFVSAPDDTYYRGFPEDYLLVDFGSPDVSQAAKLVLRANVEWKKAMCIHVQVSNGTGEWTDVAIVRTRNHWSTIIVELADHLPNPDGSLKIRLYFTGVHKIDFVGLDTTPQEEYNIHEAPLIHAEHSEDGVVTFKLLKSDDVYAELVPNQQIQLYFVSSNQPSDKQRTFIFKIEGHYYTVA
jgi:hypothetical protein